VRNLPKLLPMLLIIIPACGSTSPSETPTTFLSYSSSVGVRPEPLVLFPDLIHRRYPGSRLQDEAVSSIATRCWYPEELQERIRKAGFVVTGSWGGYEGEPYGPGPELIGAHAEA